MFTKLIRLVGVALLFGGFAAAQNAAAPSTVTRCSSMLRYGGYCVSRRQGCSAGSFEYPAFSNFVGCYRTDQVCCAWQQDKGKANPSAPIPVTPPRKCGLGSGTIASRILDGRLTGPCDWPFVVSIRGRTKLGTSLAYEQTISLCAGVLVADNWVLTSPFCVLITGSSEVEAPNNILVVAGEYNVTGIDIDPLTGRQQEQILMVEKAFIHPTYKYKALKDIAFDDTVGINSDAVALLKLSSPINGRCSGVACLPTQREADNECASYDNCVITGWGFTTESNNKDNFVNTLMMGENRLSSRVACDFLSRRLKMEKSRPAGTTCQGPRDRVTDGCFGDEGGAILCNNNGRNWVVRGILPSNICANDSYNIFVTDVAPYMTWISDTMKRN